MDWHCGYGVLLSYQHVLGSPQKDLWSVFCLRLLEHQARLLGAKIDVFQKAGASWEPQLEAIKRQIKHWGTKGLSLRGKVLIMKVILLSKITFLLHVQEMPKGILNRLDRMLALAGLSSIAAAFPSSHRTTCLPNP